MLHYKLRSILIALFSVFIIQNSTAQSTVNQSEKEMLEDGIRILRTYFLENSNWHMVDGNVESDINGLIHYIETAPLDTVVNNLSRRQKNDSIFVFRLPENVPDSLNVEGYIAAAEVRDNIALIRAQLEDEVRQNPLPVPPEVALNAKLSAPLVGPDDGLSLFSDSLYAFPDSLIIPEVIPDSMLNSPDQFSRLVTIDSLRNNYVEQKRLEYNDSISTLAIARAEQQYRQNLFNQQLHFRVKRYRDSVEYNNYAVLKAYNDRVIASVNDTIRNVIDVLSRYADFMDTVKLSISNLDGKDGDIVLQNGREHFARVWLKNEQNDSLQVLLKSNNKRNVEMRINDGVTLQRFSQRQTKNFDFETLTKGRSRFSKPGNAYEVKTPWKLGGEGSIGFTQTHYENWSAGGESALTLLAVLSGSANYTSADSKVKWENSAKLREGWQKTSGDSELQKTNDKFELASRFGVSAFNKWYYSTEFTFNTQLFKYNSTSMFLGPSRSYLKLGLDYKPNNKFSWLLSPLSVKNVYVMDTSYVDQTSYGIAENRKAYWETGLNADLTFKKKITSDIAFETQYTMFVDYRNPFSSWDIDWENNLSVKLTDYITLKVMLHLLYDDSVMFTVYDDDGNDIGEETRLQLEEFVTIGFSYTINKNVKRTRRIR